MEKPPEENSQNKPWDWKEYYELIGEKGHTKDLEVAVNYCKEKDLKEMMIEGEKFDIRLTAEEAKQKGVIHEIGEKFDFFDLVK